MQRRNGTPPDQRQDRTDDEGVSIVYINKKFDVRNLDLPSILKAVKDAIFIIGLFAVGGNYLVKHELPWQAPPPPAPISIESLKAAFTEALTEWDASRPATKSVPMKGSGKPKAKPIPTAPKPAPLINMLRSDEVIVIRQPTIPVMAAVYPQLNDYTGDAP